ncbi:MAG: YifB family Mg chelatase-like AAA ATPase [Gemmatimonadetes bacterium]|nr:YifB family Mg chelatase-like AAA ATPase [Gemmatimonadota bacterium]
MLSRVSSGAVQGIEAIPVVVETHITNGLPHFSTVGLPDSAVRESKDRVVAAIKQSGFTYPYRRITVNLAPADVRKAGTSFDLPIAVGILAASAQLPVQSLEGTILLGELSLDGTLRPIRGALPVALAAQRLGARRLIVPSENAEEAAMGGGIDVYGVPTLESAVQFLQGLKRFERSRHDAGPLLSSGADYPFDFSIVKGQDHAKRALEVAAAGSHNLLLIGPPGSGKTLLARCVPSILPDFTLEEALETTQIHSVAGRIPPFTPLVTNRPYRAPHHTITEAGLIGGGSIPKPGEVSLAHNGVLFLDELPEFRKHVLEMLRQPLEDGKVNLSRVSRSLSYPARFTLVAAMNPCPCGYLGDPGRECTCPPARIHQYMSRISGPLLDRIDLHVEVPPVPYGDLGDRSGGEPSRRVRDRINRARERQLPRFADHPGAFGNAHMTPRELRRYCGLDRRGHDLLRNAITRLGLSARAYDRVLKVARTISDLAGRETIGVEQVAEAIQYRSLDRGKWMDH